MLLPFLKELNSKRIVLASQSENRKNILSKSGLLFEISPSSFKEDLPKSEYSSPEYVVKTSEMKLIDKYEELKGKKERVDIIITADTIISIDDKQIIEKPEDKDHAFKILKTLVERGHHDVYTSVWIAFVDSETQEITKKENILNKTLVYFNKLDDQTIWSYIETGEPFGKAGGYGIQGQAATFISKIEGCYYSVWGFPLAQFCEKLTQMIPQS